MRSWALRLRSCLCGAWSVSFAWERRRPTHSQVLTLVKHLMAEATLHSKSLRDEKHHRTISSWETRGARRWQRCDLADRECRNTGHSRSRVPLWTGTLQLHHQHRGSTFADTPNSPISLRFRRRSESELVMPCFLPRRLHMAMWGPWKHGIPLTGQDPVQCQWPTPQ